MPTPSTIKRGYSLSRQPEAAARELAAQLAGERPGLVVFFSSTCYDLDVLGPALAQAFGDIPVIGCTTAGEIGPTGYVDGALTGFSLPAGGCQLASRLIPRLSAFQIADGHAAVDALAGEWAASGRRLDKGDSFALVLADGMARMEELLLAALSKGLPGVPMLGGSAGDDLKLQHGHVYWQGRFHSDAALLALIRVDFPFAIASCHHFTGSATRMVVTKADPARRIVREINAEPAALEFARIVGLDVGDLSPLRFAEYPVMVKIGGEYFVRSIQSVNDDGSLTFYCAIDKGIVLTLAERGDILDNLRCFLERERARLGAPELVVGFDCINRSLEMRNKQLRHRANKILADNRVIGFSTYGEQLNGMHLNHTFTALILGAPPDAPARSG